MRAFAICSCIVALAGCAKGEQQPAQDSTAAQAAAAMPAPPPAPPAISLADVAGTWNMQTMAAESDSVLVSYQMTATADTTGWVFHFPKRPPVPIRVLSVAGDSVVTEAGPYQSVLRSGAKVTTHSVMRLKDGKLVATTVAHYAVAGADSVRNLRAQGTRAP